MNYKNWSNTSQKFDLYNSDCIDFLEKHCDKIKVDCIFTSPPYFQKRSYSNQGKNQGNKANYYYSTSGDPLKNEIGYGQTFEDYLNSLDKLCYLSSKILKDNCFFIVIINKIRGNKKTIDLADIFTNKAEKYDFDLRDKIIWIKNNPRPLPPNSIPYYLDDCWETILVFSKKNAILKNRDIFKSNIKYTCDNCNNVKYHNNSSNIIITNVGFAEKNYTDSEHPAKFPITLPDKILPLYCNKGDLVFDPFSGSGSTLVSCIKNDFNFLGCELNPDFYNNTINEVNDILTQGDQLSIFT